MHPMYLLDIRKVLRTWVREHSASCAKVVEFDCPAEVVPAEGKFWRFWEARKEFWKTLLSKMKEIKAGRHWGRVQNLEFA